MNRKREPVHHEQQAGVPGATPFGAIARPEPSKPEAPREQRRRFSVGAVVRGTAAGLLCTGAVVLFGIAGTASADHQSDLLERGKGVAVAQERIVAATIGIETLPSESDAKRWLTAATSASATVSGIQNTFLENIGPLDLSGVPADYQDPSGRSVAYTEAERTELAQEARAEKVAGLDRQLLSFFTGEDTDDEGMNAASNWLLSLDGLRDDPIAPTLRWSTPEVVAFDQHGQSALVWELRRADGSLAAWATATFDHATVKMTGLTLHESAPADGGAR